MFGAGFLRILAILSGSTSGMVTRLDQIAVSSKWIIRGFSTPQVVYAPEKAACLWPDAYQLHKHGRASRPQRRTAFLDGPPTGRLPAEANRLKCESRREKSRIVCMSDFNINRASTATDGCTGWLMLDDVQEQSSVCEDQNVARIFSFACRRCRSMCRRCANVAKMCRCSSRRFSRSRARAISASR